jgi:type VI secretion system secreted protein VgrG
MSTRAIDFDLHLGIDQPFWLVSGKVAEAISEPTLATLEIAADQDLELDKVLAQPAVLTLLLDGIPARRWTLRVGRAAFVGITDGSPRYAIELHAPIWLLRHTINTRKFRDLSAKDIVSKVLGECGIPFGWKLAAPLSPQSYCVQYRESNFAFVSRLLEFEGVYYTTGEDGVLILEDTSASSPPVGGGGEGEAYFDLLDAAGSLDRDALGIHALQRFSRVASGTATVNDFNWKKPRLGLMSSISSKVDAELEVYDYPTGYREPDEGALLARHRLEAHRVPSRTVEGRGNVVGFAPAHRFVFGSNAGDLFAGEYVIVRVEHTFENARAGASTTYGNGFRAIPRSAPFRPPLVTPRPVVAGNHTAMVRGPGNEIHTDSYGRFKAQFHWDREATGTDADSRWMRMLQEPATSMTLARVGWEMNVAYVDGDPDRPVGISRHINGVMLPTYSQPRNKTMMSIKTPSSPATGGYNELKLEDSAGAMEFALRAEKDFIGLTEHDKSETIGNNEQHAVVKTLQHVVQHDQTVAIGASSTTTVANDHEYHVDGDRTRTVGGSESVHVDGSQTLSAEKNEKETVGSVRLTIDGSIKMPDFKAMAKGLVPDVKSAAMGAAQAAGKSLLGGGGVEGAAGAAGQSLQSMIPTPAGVASQMTGGLSDGVSLDKLANLLCHGSIGRTGQKLMTRRVGGAFISVAAQPISTTVKYGYAETVGGAKITVSLTGSIVENIKGPMVLTVGGAILRSSKGAMTVSTKSTKVNVGAVAKMSSDERVEIRGKVVSLEASAALNLKSGGLEIAMTPAKIALKGPLRTVAGAEIVVTGAPDNLTK